MKDSKFVIDSQLKFSIFSWYETAPEKAHKLQFIQKKSSFLVKGVDFASSWCVTNTPIIGTLIVSGPFLISRTDLLMPLFPLTSKYILVYFLR